MREEIVEIIEKHLKKIEGVNIFQWLNRALEDDEYPAVVMMDRVSKIGYSGHALHLEFSIIVGKEVNASVAKESRRVMQQVADRLKDACEEMKLNSKLTSTLLEIEESSLKGRLNFEVIYTATEWSI